MLETLSENWLVISGVVAGIAALLERTFKFVGNRRQKQQAYNHCLLDMVKLLFAYFKQKEMLFSAQSQQVPLIDYHLMISRGTGLQTQLDAFNAQMDKNVGLVPELILQSNVMTDMMQRLFLLEHVYAGSPLTEEGIATLYNYQRVLLGGEVGKILEGALHEMSRIALRHGSLPRKYQARMRYIFDPQNAKKLSEVSLSYMADITAQMNAQAAK